MIDEADIGRSTFYAHFETKDELLKVMCKDIFDHVFSEEIMDETYHDFSDKDRITHILCHLQEKQQSIKEIFSANAAICFCGISRNIYITYLT